MTYDCFPHMLRGYRCIQDLTFFRPPTLTASLPYVIYCHPIIKISLYIRVKAAAIKQLQKRGYLEISRESDICFLGYASDSIFTAGNCTIHRLLEDIEYIIMWYPRRDI